MSLGGLNYCLNALIDKGFVKMQNFQNSKNKFKYAYLLTPQGIAEKVALTSRFLQRKMEEYEALKAEIEALKAEVGEDNKGIALGNDRFAEQIGTPTGKPLASGKTGRPVNGIRLKAIDFYPFY